MEISTQASKIPRFRIVEESDGQTKNDAQCRSGMLTCKLKVQSNEEQAQRKDETLNDSSKDESRWTTFPVQSCRNFQSLKNKKNNHRLAEQSKETDTGQAVKRVRKT